MEPKHTRPCREWAEPIAEWAGGSGTDKQTGQVAAHLQTCARCARAAEEQSALHLALSALPARPTSPAFEARLAARLADSGTQKQRASWRTHWSDWWQAAPRLARPALALGAMTLVAAGAVFFEHVTPPATPPVPLTMAADAGLVSHCVEQHRTEDAAQPLSDLSAQNLAAQVDDGSSGDANANMASEDGL